MSRIKQLRMKLSEDDIKKILGRMEVFPAFETPSAIVFPTYCHNIEGGSNKLYYYKNEKIFKCYTGCSHQFDIFDFILKMQRLRGDNSYTIKEAIDFTGVDNSTSYSEEIYNDLEYLKKLSSRPSLENAFSDELERLDEKILERYPYNKDGVVTWINEGISEEVMKKFKIGYDPIKNAIVIPNYDHKGRLVGVRGRFLNPDSKAKYMPMIYNQKVLSHPTGKILYGLYQNKENIERLKVIVIFEGEKSVLKMEDFFPGNNMSVATSGKAISQDHIDALLKLEIKEVILAYDKDYTTREELDNKLNQYQDIVAKLKPYFNVSIIMDYNNKLQLKDSPADRGVETFSELLKYRVKR